MRRFSVLILGVVLACASAKKTPGTDQGTVTDTATATDTVTNTDTATASDSVTATDTATDIAVDEEISQPPVKTYWDRSLPKVPLSDLTSPVPFKAGAAVVRMPAPLGVCTAGFGPSGGARTPFTNKFPGTWTIFMHPQFRAVALEGGMGRLVIIRCDMVGALSGARQTVVKKLKAATGHDFSNELILSGTHTHSGPGRLATGIFAFLLDTFWPEFYDRITNAMAMAALQAIQAMKPAKFGWVMASDSLIHHDRRCENPELEDPQMPLLRFDDLDGNTIALILVYAVHGTILSEHLHHLSRDVAGGIEEKIQEKIGGSFPVLFINSWAADMGPGEALNETAKDKSSPDIPDQYTKIEGIGNRAAKTVSTVWNTFKFTTDVNIKSQTFWIPLNREAIGYKDDEFPYKYGAVYCTGDGPCWQDGEDPDANRIKGLDHACIPFQKDLSGPDRTLFTVGRINNLYFATWPGEAVTSIGEDIRDYLLKKKADAGFAFFGYSQDYTGYSTPEWDWWLGGYEASGAMWGPKQGDYITARIHDGLDGFLTGSLPPDLQATAPIEEPEYSYDTSFVPTPSTDPGVVVTDVNAVYGLLDTVQFDVNGGDPWLLAPVAVLNKRDGNTFKPMMKTDGKPFDSNGYEFFVSLTVDPTYTTKNPDTRKFTWKFTMPITRAQAEVTPITPGDYKLTVTGKYIDKDGEIKSFTASSKEFSIQDNSTD